MPRTSLTPTGKNNTLPQTLDEDVRLRDGLIAGDERAWKTFSVRHGRLVSTTIARVVCRFGKLRDSEDIREIEATFAVELIANDKAKLRAFQPERGARFSTWLSMLASHAAYDYLRRRRREPKVDPESDADTFASRSPDPHALCELGERIRLLESVTRSFTPKDREFLELYYGEGLEPDQVATRMGISVKTVYTKKYKIQGRLEALLHQTAA